MVERSWPMVNHIKNGASWVPFQHNLNQPRPGRSRARASLVGTARSALAGALLCGSAQAQVFNSSYDVSHTFTFYPGFWPAPGVPVGWFVPTGVGSVSSHAYARTPGFAPQSQLNGAASLMPPPALLPSAALAVSGPSHANASASVLAVAGPFGSVSGLTSARGSATAVGPGSTAFAHSSATYVLGGLGWRRGFIRWIPSIAAHVGGTASATNPARKRDPVSFVIHGPAGGIVESGDFLNVQMVFEAAGIVSWSGTTMSIAPNATTLLEISLGDANNAVANYVPDSSEGSLRLRLVNGTVVESSKSGPGAWLSDWSLPAVGSTFSGDIATSDGFEFGWDFGRNVDANITLDMGGMTPVPEPAEWAAMAAAGLVGFALWRRRAR